MINWWARNSARGSDVRLSQLFKFDQAMHFGKQAFLEFLGEETVSIMKIEISNIWVSTDSELALKIADFETHFSDPSLPIVSGTHIWGLRKEKGEWKIQMITWTMKAEHVSEGNG